VRPLSPLLFFLLGYCTGWYRREDPFLKDYERALRDWPGWR
jgi:hypothetical protein